MPDQLAPRKVKPALRIGVCYDFRNPPDSGVSDQYLYAEIMQQVKWLDAIGADLRPMGEVAENLPVKKEVGNSNFTSSAMFIA